MKRLLGFLLLIICIASVSLAAEPSTTVLKNSSKLDSKSSYICGSFHEDDISYLADPYIHLIISQLDTNQHYDIPFNRTQHYSYYPLLPGHYKIIAFNLHFPRIGDTSNTSFWAKLGINMTTTIIPLKVNPELLKTFEVKKAENLYIGDYFANFAKSASLINYGIIRTARISLHSSFENLYQEYLNSNANSSLVLRPLDIQEITSPEPPVYKGKVKAAIAGRFVLLNNTPGKTQLIVDNLATKKRYWLSFSAKNQLQYLEITPGVYYIEAITYDASAYFSILPKDWMLPFEIKPNELLYLGGLGIQVQKNQISSTYAYDWEHDQTQLQNDYGKKHYTINGNNASPKN